MSLKKVDKEKITKALALHLPIEILTYFMPRVTEQYCYEVLSEFLIQCRQDEFVDKLTFIVGELLTNAKKANTKRIYFAEKNLDIYNPSDYEKGMKTFKSDTLSNVNYYLELQKKYGYYIIFRLHYLYDCIHIEVRNNAVLTFAEKDRIREKLETDEVSADETLDMTEGGGLGLRICILMLRELGLKDNSIKVFSDNYETISQITIPCDEICEKELIELSKTFVNHQNFLPISRSNFEDLNKLLNEPVPDLRRITNLLSEAVTLTTLLLKEADFSNDMPCTIPHVLNQLGLEKIRKIFSEENPDIKLVDAQKDNEIFEHSKRVAMIAYNLAKNYYPEEPLFADEMYTIGLIHDYSTFLISEPSEEQKNAINELQQKMNVPDFMIKSFYENRSHSLVEKYLFEKYNFPEKVITVNLYQNDPTYAPEEERRYAKFLYLADMIDYYNTKQAEFYQFNKSVLAEFEIYTSKNLKHLIAGICL